MQQLPVPECMDMFVKDIFIIDSDAMNKENSLLIYADGFPGIIYSKSVNPFYRRPDSGKLPDFYLYGLTIDPTSLHTKGAFYLIGMRLYPFALKLLFGVCPREMSNDCFDLRQIDANDIGQTLDKLRQTDDKYEIVDIIAHCFQKLMERKVVNQNILTTIHLIHNSNGLITVKELKERLQINRRTLERIFVNEIGVTVKQFAKIIQFNASLTQLTKMEYESLAEIGYDNGYADQSHFIRSFKKYTGKSPGEFIKQQALPLVGGFVQI